MKIALDLDEVLAEFMEALLSFYHKKTGKLYKKEEFKEYKWWPIFGISREEAVKIVDEFHESYSLDEIKPVELAVEKIGSLLKKGDELYIITARPARFIKKAEDWVRHHFKTDKIKIIPSGDFHEGQAANKSDICKELGITIILEDSGETALQCAEQGINVILFDKPWNKMTRGHKKIARVSNWEEAVKEINNLKNKIT